ncbi:MULTISPECIES: 1-aminocyclopropane-1-carboxylate deaminase/D-cysteine desulfhydrase [unclassified Streptomyces]|uniref:1-aminocyclopropane-1-carboxylate deaminase/D-cysteine desulfhydrase n=1 Tax=unclassified Streptomyces TaxID=2593676 RepID=UPI00036A7F35|nr:pyridoxal-phosphate dependent enzyme [Streptomyces sp. LaPpAH-202]MYW57604.1 pyridoxal-phosphate dependent enzyme [Streptomyces sp. SID8370]MYW83690.1 pyridoxal-phosphate dependent enzyme [Streptomyces sp. SID8371]
MSAHPDPVPPVPEPSVPRARDGRARREPVRPLLPSPVQELREPAFERYGVRLLLKRDDLIHPDIPGNKWRKLAPVLREADGRTVVTFGGAWSNHLRATAAAGRLLGFPTVGVVRGEELAGRPLNPSLARCRADGMRLAFVSRSRYRLRGDAAVRDALVAEAAGPGRPVRVVPEGGSDAAAVRACAVLGEELAALRESVPAVAVACGTGGTLAGLAAGLAPEQEAVGVAVLKGGFLGAGVAAHQRAAFGGERGRWTVADGFHHGGYARTTPELEEFATAFEQRHGLSVERVYVAKLLHGLAALAADGRFRRGTALAAVVTGRPFPEA